MKPIARRAFAFILPLLAGSGIALAARADTIELPDHGGTYAVRVTSLKEARFLRTIRQQFDFSCGSAAVATLMTYHYGQPTTEQAVFEEMFAHGDQQKIRKEGFSLLDMKMYLEAHGFVADGFELPLEQLAQTHVPAIVLITESGYHHFVVVKGIRDGQVLVGDPALGTRAMSRAAFDAAWDSRVLFVVHNHEELAQFNQPVDWRVAPRAPLAMGIDRSGLNTVVMPKFGPSDF
ncbi:peptidase C39 [Pandoraea terrae]|uniref:Peptidase C39 n=1 Tax=Pandoraea terrae TaxID=1537710 RepID=A0A5E4RXZ3_9BURK|nr:C39 family peptidase [Pandoraea terrae]VVD67995.1 peptidase C39 [Pandoraea terrae]